MPGIGFLYNDRSRAATITGSAVLGDGALTNLQDPQPRTRARFSASPCNVILALPAAVSCDAFALISTGLTSGATFRLRTSATDATVTGSLSHDSTTIAAATGPEHNGQVIRILSAPVSARYVRWDLTDTAPIDIGKAPFGLLFRPARAASYGGGRGRADAGIRDINARTGTHFGLDGARARFRQIVLEWLTTAEADGDLRAMDRDYGAARDVLFVPNVDLAFAELNAECIWGAWKPSGAEATARTALPTHRRAFSLVERL